MSENVEEDVVSEEEQIPVNPIPKRGRKMTPELLEKLAEARAKAKITQDRNREIRRMEKEVIKKEKQKEKEEKKKKQVKPKAEADDEEEEEEEEPKKKIVIKKKKKVKNKKPIVIVQDDSDSSSSSEDENDNIIYIKRKSKKKEKKVVLETPVEPEPKKLDPPAYEPPLVRRQIPTNPFYNHNFRNIY